MNEPGTMHNGPLGSTIHVLHADADTITALAAVDWSRHFRRVCLDPVREEEGAYSRDSREPAAHQGRQESGRTEHRAHHG